MVSDEAKKAEKTASDAATTTCDKIETTNGVDTDTVQKEVEKVEKEVKQGYDTVSLKPSRRVLVRGDVSAVLVAVEVLVLVAGSPAGTFAPATLFARSGPPLGGSTCAPLPSAIFPQGRGYRGLFAFWQTWQRSP